MYGVGESSPRRRGWLVIIGVMVLVLILAGLFFVFYTLVLKKDGESPAAEVTPTTVQIVEAATDTVAPPKNTATSEPAVSRPAASTAASTTTPIIPSTVPPTNIPQPTLTLRPPPEAITISVRARINITEGLLNLRDLPTLSGSTVITQMVPGAEVNVIGGPEDVGDLRWWNVNGGEGRVGWIVEAFGGETYLVPLGWVEQMPPLVTPTPTHTPTPTPTSASATPTAVVTPTVTIALTPTATPDITVTATPAATPEITVAATPALTPTITPEGGIPSPTVGGRAEVTTRFQFVNLRTDPGLDAEIVGQLENGTIVTILDGPEEADDLRWWQVEDGEGNGGWAAERVVGEVLLVPIP